MNDPRERFEQELRQMLAVDASPNLQSRIRARAFEMQTRRYTWLAWSSGLAVGIAAIILAVLYIQPKQTDVLPTSPQIAVQQTVPPTTAVVPPEKPTPKQAGVGAVRKRATATIVWTRVEVEVAPLKEFKLNDSIELADSITPIPELPVLSVAHLDPINIEPPAMTVGKLE